MYLISLRLLSMQSYQNRPLKSPLFKYAFSFP
nr:MAG TPA: hypothetical protein [Caudoviricetes sp.]